MSSIDDLKGHLARMKADEVQCPACTQRIQVKDNRRAIHGTLEGPCRLSGALVGCPREKLEALAFDAGRFGIEWLDFTFRDDVEALVESADTFDSASAQEAFERGRREWLAAPGPIGAGWVATFTTAPADFDWFGTETIEALGEWFGKPLRRVASDPHYAVCQRDRYSSGIYFVGDYDPRVREAEEKAKRERYRNEDAERARKRAIGLAWLCSLSDEQLEHVSLDDGDDGKGAHREDVRTRRAERSQERHDAARSAAWAAAIAIVPSGATLIDHGTKGFRSKFDGRWIPGIPTHVYYGIGYGNCFGEDPEKATVESGRAECAGSLAEVAEYVKEGRFQVVDYASVPPRAVLERFGQSRLKEIECVEAPGAPGGFVWVARLPGSFGELTALNARGHLVRGKKILEAASRGRRWNVPYPVGVLETTPVV